MAVNAVCKNGGSCAGTSNPNMKYMAIPQGKEWKLGETDISFTVQDVQFKRHGDLRAYGSLPPCLPKELEQCQPGGRHMGHGTRYNYEVGMEVLEEERALAVFLQDGRVGIFSSLLIGEETFNYEDSLLLRRRGDSYELLEPDTGCRYQLAESVGDTCLIS